MDLKNLQRVINEALELNEDVYEVKELPEGNFVLHNKTKNTDGLKYFLTREEAEEECKWFNAAPDFEDEEDTDDMIQCVIKIKDIGNVYEYQELIEDDTDYLSQYDVDVEFQDEEEDPTIQFILAYHNPAEFVFYDENGEELDLEQPGNDDFPDDEQI